MERKDPKDSWHFWMFLVSWATMMMCVFNPQMVQLLGLGEVHHVEDQRCPKFGPEFLMIWALLFLGWSWGLGRGLWWVGDLWVSWLIHLQLVVSQTNWKFSMKSVQNWGPISQYHHQNKAESVKPPTRGCQLLWFSFFASTSSTFRGPLPFFTYFHHFHL